MERFWEWKNEAKGKDRTLYLNGVIAEDSWFDDDVTPKEFKDELTDGDGDITVWINSPGGDCIAAAQIYNMLMEYPHNVTVKIDGIAASAASVIAMAGTEVLVSPVSMMMIHNPATMAWGDSAEMEKVADMLSEVKESIINAYELKTAVGRTKISHLMDAETWMDANKAVELGFADGILFREKDKSSDTVKNFAFSPVNMAKSLTDKMIAKCKIEKPSEETEETMAENKVKDTAVTEDVKTEDAAPVTDDIATEDQETETEPVEPTADEPTEDEPVTEDTPDADANEDDNTGEAEEGTDDEPVDVAIDTENVDEALDAMDQLQYQIEALRAENEGLKAQIAKHEDVANRLKNLSVKLNPALNKKDETKEVVNEDRYGGYTNGIGR